MAFFLIVPSVMIVSILLVHALANRLGLRIYYTTLVAVAVLSFMVDYAAAFVTPAVGREYLLRLGIIIVVVSLLLTFANRFLIEQQRTEEERFTEEVKAAYEAEKKKTLKERLDAYEKQPVPPKYNEAFTLIDDTQEENKLSATVDDTQEEKLSATIDDAQEENKLSATINDTQEEKLSATVDDTQEEKLSATVDDTQEEKISATVDDTQEEVIKNSEVPESFPLEKVFKPLPQVKPEEADKPVKLEEKPDPAENFPLEEVFEPLPEVEPEKIEPPVEPKGIPKHVELFPLQEVFRPLSTLRLDKIEEITQEEKISQHEDDEESADTLDELLDKAYNERDKGHVWQAIELYKKALERYHNDDYAPFVAIDLGNIYKEQALYSKAIKIYEDALKLPSVKRNELVKKEFINNLAYLRVVRDILLKHHMLSTPFGNLSKEILQEIDIEFNKVQINSAQ